MSENVSDTSWTKEQVEELVKREKLNYQKIALPYGLTTGGKDRSATLDKIFGDDIKGKSILDVGCFLGYFCYEAIKRGAGRVVGVDVNEERLRKARLLADCLGMPVEFKQLDIEKEKLTDQFDIILMLNVLHHFSNPISVIDKVIPHTKERLIMEVAGPASPLAKKYLKELGASWWTRRQINRLPLVVVGRDGLKNNSEQKFFIAPSAMENLLMQQRRSFSKLEIEKSGFKDRYVAIAWKVRVDNLLVIGGATSTGKTTLIERLMRKELPELAGKIGMDSGTIWTESNASDIIDIGSSKVQNMIYHYDILRSMQTDVLTYEKERGMDVMDCAEKRTVVTLWCEPEVLCQRVRPKLEKVKRSWHHKKLSRTMELYQNKKQLAELYSNWISYCRQKKSRLIFINCTNEPCIMTETQWEQKINDLTIN